MHLQTQLNSRSLKWNDMKATRQQMRKLEAEFDKIQQELIYHLTEYKINWLSTCKHHTYRNDPESLFIGFADQAFTHTLDKFANKLDERIEMNRLLDESKDIINNGIDEDDD